MDTTYNFVGGSFAFNSALDSISFDWSLYFKHPFCEFDSAVDLSILYSVFIIA